VGVRECLREGPELLGGPKGVGFRLSSTARGTGWKTPSCEGTPKHLPCWRPLSKWGAGPTICSSLHFFQDRVGLKTVDGQGDVLGL
jgi:hypothetical protein